MKTFWIVLCVIAASTCAAQSSGNTPELKEVRVFGACSGAGGVAVDRSDKVYQARWWVGCDNFFLNVEGPNYSVNFGVFSRIVPNSIAVDSAGNAYVTGLFDYGDDWTILFAVNPLPGCNIDSRGSLTDTTFLMKLDPHGGIIYSTCIPGVSSVNAIAVDGSGAVYVTGDGGYVAKIDSVPSLVYKTVLSPLASRAVGRGIAVDSSGTVYVTGNSGPGLPTVNAIQPTGSGAYVAKLNPAGTSWLFATYLNGTIGGPSGNAIAIDSAGNAYVAGDGAFVTKLNSTGSTIVYTKRLEGNGATKATGIAVDSRGGAYVTGNTSAADFPMANAIQPIYGGAGDVFISLLNSAGNALTYSTFLGGSGRDGFTDFGIGRLDIQSIAVDSKGTAYVVGTEISLDFLGDAGCIGNDDECFSSQFLVVIGPFTTAKTSASTLSFPTQLLGTSSAPKHIALTNTGTAQMTVGGLTATNGFTQTNTCNKGVKPGTHCDIYVKFAPSVGGTTTGSLTLSDNTPSSPQTISLSGTATAIGLTPSALSFSARRVGTKSSAKSVVVKNHGTNAVLISAITLAGNNPKDFSFTTNCGASLSPNATCSIAAKFAPTAKGIRKATINVFDDGGGSPQKASITGQGT